MARDFIGSGSNYMYINDTPSIDITGNYLTMMCWVNYDALNNNNVFGKATNAVGTCQYQFQNQNNPSFFIGDGATLDVVTGGITLQTGKWYCQVGVKDGIGANALRLYMNGKLDGVLTSNISIQNTATPLFWGVRGSGGDLMTDGRIAHCALWDAPLTSAEIKAIYEGISPLRVRPGNLRGYWPMDDYSASAGPGGLGGCRDVSKYQAHASMFSANALAAFPTPEATPRYLVFGSEVSAVPPVTIPPTADSATVYLDLTITGTDDYSPPCFLIGEGEADLRWRTSDDFLRWLGNDAHARWDANLILGTAQC